MPVKTGFFCSRLPMLAAGLALMICMAVAPPTQATDKADLSIALKTLPLLNEKMADNAVMAVVYDPGNPASKAEADTVMAAIDTGLEAPGGIKITGMPVALADIGGKLPQVKLAFVTKGACTDAVDAAANTHGILTITTDIDCVKANKCILGVVSAPKVQIYYSSAAADAARVGFSSAFTMLVKRI